MVADRIERTCHGHVAAFVETLGLKRYALYVFDYGAPVGFRLARAHTERVSAIVSQNGNAYEEGLGAVWGPFEAYWREPSAANREALRDALTLETTRWAYTHGVPDSRQVAPETYHLDAALMARPERAETSSTCSSTTRATSRSTRPSRPTSVRPDRPCWRSPANTTNSLSPRVHARSCATA